MAPTYSFVIPVHDEEDSLPPLYVELRRLFDALDGSSEVIFVDDGSTDASIEVLQRLRAGDRRCKIVELSRNFGHQRAVSAGLAVATGEAVVVMDADLQDPPHVVLDMADRWREGYDVVYGVRQDRPDDTWFKRTTAAAFYRLIGRCSSVGLPPDVGDFRLIDRKVVDAFNGMGEKNRYVRGMFTWIGFRQTGVPYVRPARAEGETSYSVTKMLRLAEDGIVGFSQVPLRLVLVGGLATTSAGLATGAVAGGLRLVGRRAPAGTTTVATALSVGGLQLLAVGVVGQYVGRIMDEAVDRPLYVVRSTAGLEPVRRAGASETVIDLGAGRAELAGKVG